MAVLALDLMVAAFSAYILLDRVKRSFAAAPPIVQAAPVERMPDVIVPPPEPVPEKPAPAPIVEKTPPPKIAKRNISFSYRDPFAKRVSVAGSFNGWSPQLMKKDASNRWTLTVKVPEGRHAYNFIVDGKTIRDPSAKGFEKVAGRKFPASVLVVKAAS
ncbi:MAG: hypothetical protein A2901_00685 [Elusimicrobia bacterium RIFCSPLOWO2_01_FULL_54_10]|nr:MAG: hypothetical protein A2901_00685 [Elusimicrobia bacterium RIFCSPLOWO2_01_FULL_54_10]